MPADRAGRSVTITTSRLVLQPYTAESAERVLAGIRDPHHPWAAAFPLFEETDFLRALVIERRRGVDPGVFAHYQVQLRAGGEVIGGAGFFGAPDSRGAVEIILGLVPSHLGNGYGAEIVSAFVDVAATGSARFIRATVSANSVSTLAALTGAGLVEVEREGSIVTLERALDGSGSRPPRRWLRR
jgi:RimJ/RimL family protein N-acetyltransferase